MDAPVDPDWARLIAAGRARWRGIRCSDDVLKAGLVKAGTAAAAGPWAVDLVLATACAAGDSGALSHFERDFVSSVPSYVAKMRLDAAVVDELKQQVRVRALSGSPPSIAKYQGTGPLEGWVRVMTVRLALSLRRDDHRRREVTFDDLLPALREPAARSLAFVSTDRAAFERALEDALSSLAPRERTLLRMNLLDGVSIDGLAELHGVHRATAARWLVSIRKRIHRLLRAKLSLTHPLSSGDLMSLVQHLRGDIELSLHRVLATRPPASERNGG